MPHRTYSRLRSKPEQGIAARLLDLRVAVQAAVRFKRQRSVTTGVSLPPPPEGSRQQPLQAGS